MAEGSKATARTVAGVVRSRIERGGERVWRLDDFRDLPFPAVAQALSRLARGGRLERLSKGTYYRGRSTAFGASRANPASVESIARRSRSIFPSGIAAASLLGFTTQVPARREVATHASSLPRKLVGPDATIHTRRPAAWADLSEVDAALLDFLRRRGGTSELPPRETIRRTLELLAQRGRYKRLLRIASTEPPRVRAMLGALGERLGTRQGSLAPLRDSLNSLSRFDFGVFAELPNARRWHAKEHRT